MILDYLILPVPQLYVVLGPKMSLLSASLNVGSYNFIIIPEGNVVIIEE